MFFLTVQLRFSKGRKTDAFVEEIQIHLSYAGRTIERRCKTIFVITCEN